jgi:hypothetical protein
MNSEIEPLRERRDYCQKLRLRKRKRTRQISSEYIINEILKEAKIKRCPKKDQDERPKCDQQWCLYDSKGEKLLGRHPTKEDALAQERAIQIHKHR